MAARRTVIAHVNDYHVYPDGFVVVNWTSTKGVPGSTSGRRTNTHMQELMKRARSDNPRDSWSSYRRARRAKPKRRR